MFAWKRDAIHVLLVICWAQVLKDLRQLEGPFTGGEEIDARFTAETKLSDSWQLKIEQCSAASEMPR